ncbi:type II and III secretion system protein family protein [Solimonas sp. SE-A11]|uniref:type II and III secretion system protein family protein n=1 Tax=Solimonas sp. SE-A11 TaxID=3054954 RepID=UPI00259CD1F0|nr:type II and III secretion system protein family protein [Solimonas sp. SE-A11]MDM4772439.1 type II and III secretion system protein family protein [Solimonas sp. SE-A11]
MKTYKKMVMALFSTLLLALPLQAPAQGNATWITVELGLHKIIRDTQAVSRVATGDPAIADVTVGGLHDVLVNGKKIGVTSLTVWNRGAKYPREFRVQVVPPRQPTSAAVQSDPDLAQAQVNPGQGVTGRLPNLTAHRRAKLAASVPKDGEITDGSDVALETQVQTQVKIAEISRSTAQRFGFNAIYTGGKTRAVFGNPGSSPTLNQTETSVLNPFNEAFNLVIDSASSKLLGALSMLEGKGLARTLAEPTLVAMSGQTATYLVGGEFPIPVVQGGGSSGGGSSSITIEYKEFGVRLALTPTVLARNRIALKVAPEVSDLDFNAGVTSGGVTVPALLVRRTETMIELGDGESFVISGLISSNLRRNVDKVPWLGQLPILGAFFRATEMTREEKELVMVVTPRLVRPLAREVQLPPLPGSKYDGYQPRSGQLFFEDASTETGFSR